MEAQADSQGKDRAEAALKAELRRIHRFAAVSGAIWVLATAACTLWGSDRVISGYLDGVAGHAERDAKATTGVVDRIFYELAAIPQVMSNSRELHRLVARYHAREDAFSRLPEEQRKQELKNDPVIARITARLTLIRNKLNYDLIYVLDSRGIRILTSDWDKPVNLLGDRLDDREYFKEAMAGEAGHMFAVSRTTRTPSFFFSAPMEDANGVVGVVVARQDFEALGAMLAGTQHVTMVASKDGMVLAASHPGFALHHLGALADRRPDPDTLRDLYAQETLRSLSVERPARPLHETQWVVNGLPYVVNRASLKLKGEVATL